MFQCALQEAQGATDCGFDQFLRVVYDDGERGRNVDDSCNALNGLVICVLLVPWSGLQVYGI